MPPRKDEASSGLWETLLRTQLAGRAVDAPSPLRPTHSQAENSGHRLSPPQRHTRDGLWVRQSALHLRRPHLAHTDVTMPLNHSFKPQRDQPREVAHVRGQDA